MRILEAFEGFGRKAVRFARDYAQAFAFFLLLVLLWQGVTGGLGWVKSYILPSPMEVIREMWASGDVLLENTWVTLVEIVLGFAVGTLFGAGAGVGIVYSRFLEKVLYPLILVTQTMPKLAIAPLFIVWFGFNIVPKIIITAMVCLFPVLINMVVGLNSVDPRVMDLMYSLSASRRQIFWKVRFPSSVPYLFAGLKVGITLATIGAIVGEWVGSDAGLGYLILLANSQLRTDLMFASIVMITALGLGLFLIMFIIEDVFSPHRPPLTVDTMERSLQ